MNTYYSRINKFVQLSVQVKSSAILSINTVGVRVENIEGGISLQLCERSFTYTDTLTAFMLHSFI